MFQTYQPSAKYLTSACSYQLFVGFRDHGSILGAGGFLSGPQQLLKTRNTYHFCHVSFDCYLTLVVVKFQSIGLFTHFPDCTCQLVLCQLVA